jgi:predicted ester cyclase
MTAEQNKAITRRFIEEGINRANLDVFDELLTEDVLNHYAPPGLPPGREGWKLNRRLFKTAFPDGRWEIADTVAEADLVVSRATFSGTHQGEFFGVPATGRRVSFGSIHIVRFAGGKIVEHWGNGDDMGLMQQIGAIPVPAPQEEQR